MKPVLESTSKSAAATVAVSILGALFAQGVRAKARKCVEGRMGASRMVEEVGVDGKGIDDPDASGQSGARRWEYVSSIVGSRANA